MTCSEDNVYLQALHRALPRLLSSFNADPTSELAGVGDRLHWGWKLIDFPNGTFQGAVHGLALLLDMKGLPKTISEASLLRRMKLIVQGLGKITSSAGSLDEALPHEASFCVTALVAADLLAARDLLGQRLPVADQDNWLETTRPLIGFLMVQDEHHGLISNHLASAALAMYRWHAATGDNSAESRGQLWLSRILQAQSSEGWFSEYGGADPGYQSWCTTQLAQLHLLRPDLGLAEPLSRSLAFLALAAHPDGSFGGSYGWRNTRFLLPGGLSLLADTDMTAASLCQFARNSISQNSCVGLDCMDAGNLVPFFNDYALAAWSDQKRMISPSLSKLPFQSAIGRHWYPDAGWLIDCGKYHYSIVNLKRGGACVAFQNGIRRLDDPGALVSCPDGTLCASQLSTAAPFPDTCPKGDEITLRFPLLPVRRPQSGPLGFLALRLASLTLFRFLAAGNRVKRLLARYLIHRRPSPVGFVSRHYRLLPEFSVTDSFEGVPGCQPITEARHFSAIHMASQGYWQVGDDDHLEKNT